ncbi:HPP family protein [Paenibacillus sp. YPG26]|uniref:HPP family protein n=1 Tax=Paenibacillus sp. YPG26 TaxID=2878915 RepID=UPI00203C4441|nr:HPP family protein [Paenibacillus sp. YPG26]USB31647.1 HPP family protein [Paenibacillus sp. YPG26]
MFLRSLIICSYLAIIYFASIQLPSLKMVFYPTLGAFSFLFIHRQGHIKDTGRIIIGAIVAATLGSLFYTIDSGVLSFFATAMITLSLIKLFRCNAAPILAVSLIPFFAHPVTIWMLPASVMASLAGLALTLWFIGKLEQLTWISRMDQALMRWKSWIAGTGSSTPIAGITEETRH